MNSLVGLGAVTSFTAGLAAPIVPGAALEVSFLEEPVMLLSFVLLGRALEARARLKASGILLVPCSFGLDTHEQQWHKLICFN